MPPDLWRQRLTERSLSHLISIVLNHLADHSDSDQTECTSQEELIAELEELNTKRDLTGRVVGSMDAKALFPSLQVHETATKIREVFETSQLKIEGIDWLEAGKLLAICTEEKELKDLGLEDVVCSRRSNGRGRRIQITTSEVMGKLWCDDHVTSLFDPPRRQPNKREEVKIFGKILEIMIIAVMKHHIYTFNGETRLQSDGGPIGLELTGALARVYMIYWDKHFTDLAQKNNIKLDMYKRYVDDVNFVTKALPPGTVNRGSFEHFSASTLNNFFTTCISAMNQRPILGLVQKQYICILN